MTELDQASDLHRFPCKTCGSDLRYAPGTQILECDHCGNDQRIEGTSNWRGRAIRELDFRKAVREGLSDYEMAEIQTFACKNCGAHTEFDADTHAAECPFCATPIVGGTGAERQIKPRGLLPDFAGDDNQSCPQIILPKGDDDFSSKYSKPGLDGARRIDATQDIIEYFIERFDLPGSHP